jgi:hypothetical protein
VDWDLVQAAFRDELEKIGEVSLAGLSPQILLAQKMAPTFETPGLAKAMGILDRYEQQRVKLAAPQVPFNPNLPQINRVTGARKRKKEETGAVEQGKSLAGHTLGGMGIGRLVGEMSHGPKVPLKEAAKQALHGKRWWGAVAGGSIGAGEFARKRIAEHLSKKKEKKAGALSTPGMQLRAARQVGTKITSRPLRSGPTLGKLTRGDHVAGTKKFGVL